jgi:hypothetical protein
MSASDAGNFNDMGLRKFIPSRKGAVFAAIAFMMAYVLHHNERFLIDWSHPLWEHFEPFKWWLLVHGVAGACAVFLAPLQFLDGLRQRHAKLHRIVGRIYVVSVFVLSPIGVYMQYLQEADGASRGFTVATVISAFLFMVTVALGLYFGTKRMITAHRQWMVRSYAIALTFFEIRLILGISGLDQNFDWAVTETVVWVCVAMAVFLGDIANQFYELRPGRARVAQNFTT